MMLRFIVLFLLAIAAAAQEPTRALRIGPSFSMLASSSALGSSPISPGLWTSYEFLLTPRFNLGIHTSFRNHSAAISLRQLTYGLLLKHAFGDHGVIPYAEYGLFLNMNFLSDRPGSGVSHNTRLAGGVEFGERFFADLAYNYSRLGFFGAPKFNLDSFELATGWRHRW